MRFFPALLVISATLLWTASALDLAPELARWKLVNMPLDLSGLSLRNKQVVMTLIAASQQMESIYWRQSDPGGLGLLLRTRDRDLKRMLMINGGRFNLLDNNRPFVGNEAASPGRALYPRNISASQVREFVKTHPDQKEAIYSPCTAIVPYGNGLQAVPYHVLYAQQLKLAADRLQKPQWRAPIPSLLSS